MKYSKFLQYGNKILVGDCRQVMRGLPSSSVHCIVTSPPYWGLRDYGVGPSVWGGDSECRHEWGDSIHGKSQSGSLNGPTLEGAKPGKERRPQWKSQYCIHCNAWLGCYGLEPSISQYVKNTVEVFTEAHRILRPDGILWLNLGDSYFGGGQGANYADGGKLPLFDGKGLKPKDLCGIPWRTALALQDAGWWLRQDIIWHKLNPMPESMTDRCTAAHEYVFMLTKSARYFFDAEAIKEKASSGLHKLQSYHNPNNKKYNAAPQERWKHQFDGRVWGAEGSRNKRSVWQVATQPYSDAHFATFPPKLIVDMIKAGTSEKGCCSECGAPWVRVVEKGFSEHSGKTESEYQKGSTANRLALLRQAAREHGGEYVNTTKTVGWQPSCECNGDIMQAIVFDPFMGSGTTAEVALRLGRKYLGAEINEKYKRLSDKRLKKYESQLF